MRTLTVVAFFASPLVAASLGCVSQAALPEVKPTPSAVAQASPTGSPPAAAKPQVGVPEEHIIQVGRTLDTDNDGVFDIDDNCSGVANATQVDSDGDGYGDPCDPGDGGVPQVDVIFPRPNDTYRAGEPIHINVGAAGNDPITKVEFYANGTKIGEVLGDGLAAGGHTLVWKRARPGRYVLTAVGIDEAGASATSESVTITVVPREE